VTGFLDLSTSMTLNDLEPLKKEVFSEFFVIFGCSAHFNTECDEMAGDRPRQPAYEIFSIQRNYLV